MADEAAATKRVELIDEGDPASSGLPGYIGVGLIGGMGLGYGPLRDAIGGAGPFEDAMLRFVACVLVCVAAASIIGRILESAPPADEPAPEEADTTRASVGPTGVDDDADEDG